MAVLRKNFLGYATLLLIVALSLLVIASVDARERDVKRDGRDVVRVSDPVTDTIIFSDRSGNYTRITETIVEEESSGDESDGSDAEGQSGGDGTSGEGALDYATLYAQYLTELGLITDGEYETISRRDSRLERHLR